MFGKFDGDEDKFRLAGVDQVVDKGIVGRQIREMLGLAVGVGYIDHATVIEAGAPVRNAVPKLCILLS